MRLPARALSSAAPAAAPGILLPGSGIFFWWQAGATTALARRYDLGRAQFAGASGGALAATLAATGCDCRKAFDVAWGLCDEARVFERGAWGLYGVWGGIVEAWLEELLPPDAHVQCNGRVNIVLRRPLRRPMAVSEFSSRADLIGACLASTHIPFFMDRRFSRRFRGQRYVDSEFLPSIPRGAHRAALALPQREAPYVRLAVGRDARVRKQASGLGASMRMISRDGLVQMMDWGEQHVRELDEAGGLSALGPLGLGSFDDGLGRDADPRTEPL